MSNTYFKFKQFTIHHDRCAMKVGTDGVLLGAWASVRDARRILDVGTGSGLIAIQLAQRNPEARITAIEIDTDASGQAQENVSRSPWGDRIEVLCMDFGKYFPQEKFDLVVSNPPYFQESLKSPVAQRNQARHTDTLPFEALLSASERLLEPGGCLCLILPLSSWECVQRLLPEHAPQLELCRLARVFSKPGKACERVMAEWVKKGNREGRASHLWPSALSKKDDDRRNEKGGDFLGTIECQDILIHDQHGSYTEEYRHLVREFYLWA